MSVSVILPVKSYSRAKSRLDIPPPQRAELCHVMLERILRTLDASPDVCEVVVVSRERRASELCDAAGATLLRDSGGGVNEAVAVADRYLAGRGAVISLVIPQDIPLIEPADVSFLLKFFTPPACVLVVPSMRLDGTNALLRCPPDIMGTSYDDNSYRNHMRVARRAAPNWGTVHVTRIMQDVDTLRDLFEVRRRAGPDLQCRINDILESAGAAPQWRTA